MTFHLPCERAEKVTHRADKTEGRCPGQGVPEVGEACDVVGWRGGDGRGLGMWEHLKPGGVNGDKTREGVDLHPAARKVVFVLQKRPSDGAPLYVTLTCVPASLSSVWRGHSDLRGQTPCVKDGKVSGSFHAMETVCYDRKHVCLGVS